MNTPLIFLGVLSVLVLVHELGHFLAARSMGIKVEEFAFGLPFTKPIFSITRGETKYAIYPLLFGGFVRMHGEESEVKVDKNRSFWNRGKKQRLFVLVAGVLMNMVLAVVGFVILYSLIGVPKHIEERVALSMIEQDSPAALAGFKVQDKILSVEDKQIYSTEEFGELMKSWAGTAVNITVERGDYVPLFEGILQKSSTTQLLTVIPRKDPPAGQGALGVAISQTPFLITEKCSIVSVSCLSGAISQGFKTTGTWLGRVIEGLRSIGGSLSRGKAPEGVAGPIGIYQLTDVVSKGGFLPILELTAILSVNLAVFNILPIPALDGGRVFFIWIEFLRRKRVSAELEQKINAIGMAVLLTLIALITLQDVIRLGFINKILGK
jgi:regulator of sigma E protease